MITLDDKINSLKREIAIRGAVYAKAIKDGKMKAANATREMEIIRAILDDYERDRMGLARVDHGTD